MVVWIAQMAKMPMDVNSISAAMCSMLGMGFLPRITLGCLL